MHSDLSLLRGVDSVETCLHYVLPRHKFIVTTNFAIGCPQDFQVHPY